MYKFAVIGAGVIGLPTALEIQKQFGPKTKITIFTSKLSPNTTGDIAAGLWTPYILQQTPQEKILRWSKATQDYILKLWQKGQAKEAGISLQVMINLSESQNFQIPEWAKITLGYSEIPTSQIQKYNSKFGKQFTGGFVFVSFVWEAAKFLPFLLEQFQNNGGEIRIKEIKSFEELSGFDVVVNCSGIQSKFLVPDELVKPIRGQIARVYAPWQFHCLMTDEHYVIPNQDCVILGGTHQEGDFSTVVDEVDKKFILDGCTGYIPSLESCPVLQNQAGLRPSRVEVRLELEERKVGDKIVKIVHNYGHGGSGVTLSIGCALEAAQLVKKAVGVNRSKL